jgi:hypothetical protein
MLFVVIAGSLLYFLAVFYFFNEYLCFYCNIILLPIYNYPTFFLGPSMPKKLRLLNSAT